MKIAIAATDQDKNTADISNRGGRAPYYHIYDNDKFEKAIGNPFSQGGGGAGTSAARMLAKEKVNKFFTGEIGPNMVQALNDEKIEFEQVPETPNINQFMKDNINK